MNNKIVWLARRLKMTGFNIYVACNMLLCSILFAGFSFPRETLSGFIGRRALMGSSAFLYLAQFIDLFYKRTEKAHCGETAMAEDSMREELYPTIQENLRNDYAPPESITPDSEFTPIDPEVAQRIDEAAARGYSSQRPVTQEEMDALDAEQAQLDAEMIRMDAINALDPEAKTELDEILRHAETPKKP